MIELPLVAVANWLADGAALATLFVVIAISGYLGWLAQRAVERGSFLKGYFLGNRGLGVWAMALTATVQSGGTFMGVPSLVYSHGWIVALWIGSYMVVPLTGFAVLGKRLAQLSRRLGAITVPDLMRGRFDSPRLGLVTSLLIMFFLTFMLVAQFKAGAIVMKLAWPGNQHLALAEDAATPLDTPYYVGLTVFAVAVVGYTLVGGFLASVWTDLFQSVLMLIGVMLLLVLTLNHPAFTSLEAITQRTAAVRPSFAAGPGYSPSGGPFLPLGLAGSYFVVWIFGGMASPASVTRVMASKNTATLRRSIFVLATYNLFIYLPLIVICIAAHGVLPLALGPKHSDEVVPRMAFEMTQQIWGGPLWAGIILVAPFGAVMATVSTFLVVIASGLVHDVYQRMIHPRATDRQLRLMTYLMMVLIGVVAVAANIDPVTYLQTLIVFCTSCGAAAFFTPVTIAAFWRRGTAAGALAAMLAGTATVLALFVVGLVAAEPLANGEMPPFRPYLLGGLEPIVWGMVVSALSGIGVSLATQPPPTEHVARLFDDP